MSRRKFKIRAILVLAALVVAAGIPLFSQVRQAGQEGGLPLEVGIGVSDFSTDWSGRIAGGTIWADWYFYNHPSFLHGLGVEVEGRDLNFGRTGSVPQLRQDTAEGGPIYTWRRHRNFHPYGKFLMGLGSIDFDSGTIGYSHDTRTVFVPGGGVEYRAWHNVWVRGDYQYQFWTNFIHHHIMNPNGVTIGVAYDFGHPYVR